MTITAEITNQDRYDSLIESVDVTGVRRTELSFVGSVKIKLKVGGTTTISGVKAAELPVKYGFCLMAFE